MQPLDRRLHPISKNMKQDCFRAVAFYLAHVASGDSEPGGLYKLFTRNSSETRVFTITLLEALRYGMPLVIVRHIRNANVARSHIACAVFSFLGPHDIS